jgi:hypothetical protein
MDRDCLAGEAVRAFTRPILGWVQDAQEQASPGGVLAGDG